MAVSKIDFYLEDYISGLNSGDYNPPGRFKPYIDVSRIQYARLYEEFKKTHDKGLDDTFDMLKERVGHKYQREIVRLQSRAIDFSQLSFPAYGFILPEVIVDDWLAIVDWHKFQRDHALHQPLCAYISQKLLDPIIPGAGLKIKDSTLLDICIDEIMKWQDTAYLRKYIGNHFDKKTEILLTENTAAARDIWKDIFTETIYIASLFHDLGYPWQYINTLNSKLRHAGFNKNKPVEDASNTINVFGQRLLFCPLNGYQYLDGNAPSVWQEKLIDVTALSLQSTHGLPGAIGFLYLNDVISDFPNSSSGSINRMCIEWAAMGIMMHDLAKIYWGNNKLNPFPANPHLRLKINKDPLSSILTLIDTLEEFARPTVSFNPYNRGAVGLYSTACDKTILEFDEISEELRITYKYRDSESLATKLPYLPGQAFELFDTACGYLDLSAAGIRKVLMTAEL